MIQLRTILAARPGTGTSHALRPMRVMGMAGLGIGLLMACAPVQPRPEHSAAAMTTAAAATPPPTGAQQTRSTVNAAAGSATPATSDLPQVRLTPEILYQLTLSEIAAQRGMSGSAFATLYALARSTGDARIARRAAEMALISRQPANALLAARLWNTLAPSSREARDTMLNLLVVTGQFEEVENLLGRDLEAPATRASTFLQVQTLLARSPRQVEAFEAMERLAAPYPQLAEARMALAQSAQRAGKKARAIDEIRAALILKPDWELAALLGGQYLEAEAPREASTLLSQFLTRNPNARAARMALGRTLAAENRFAEAAEQFQIVLRAEAGNLDAIYSLGLLAYQAKQPDQAEEYFKRYLTLAKLPGNRERNTNQVYLQLAQIAEDRKNPDAALELLDQVADGPEFIPALARRAAILSRLSRLDQARQVLQDATPSSARERVQIIQIEAQLLREANQHQATLDVLAAGLAAHPEQPELLYEHAMAAEKLDQLDIMEASLRTLIRIRPDSAHAYNALGYSLADRKLRLPEALVLIERALSLAPNDAAIIDSMGWVHYRMGNLTKALEYLQRAYALQPDAEVATHLGEVLWVSGKHAEAQRLWREASQKEPQNAVLRATLARFNADIAR